MKTLKIKKTVIPENSFLCSYLPAQSEEALECVFPYGKNFTADDLIIAFWTQSPAWVDQLFLLRDWLVKPFGLQAGSKRSKEKFEQAVRNGGSYGLMSIPAKSATETIMCLSDKHLKLYFSAQIEASGEKQKVTVSSLIYFRNTFGKFYFYAIYPFHQLIVRSLLKRALRCWQAKKGLY